MKVISEAGQYAVALCFEPIDDRHRCGRLAGHPTVGPNHGHMTVPAHPLFGTAETKAMTR